MPDYLCSLCSRELGREVKRCPKRKTNTCPYILRVEPHPQRKEGWVFLALSLLGLIVLLNSDVLWTHNSNNFFTVSIELGLVTLLLLAVGLCFFYSYSLLLSKTEYLSNVTDQVYWCARFLRGYCYRVDIFFDFTDVTIEGVLEENLTSHFNENFVRELKRSGARIRRAHCYTARQDGLQDVEETLSLVASTGKEGDGVICDILNKNEQPMKLETLFRVVYPSSDKISDAIAKELRGVFSPYALRIGIVIFLLIFLSFTRYGVSIYRLFALKGEFYEYVGDMSKKTRDLYRKNVSHLNLDDSYNIPSVADINKLEGELDKLFDSAPYKLQRYKQELERLIRDFSGNQDFEIRKQVELAEKMLEKLLYLEQKAEENGLSMPG